MNLTKKAIAVFVTILLPLAFIIPNAYGQAVLDGELTVGGAGVKLSDRSAKSGEYSGIEDNGLYFIGDADLTYDSGVRHMDLRIKDLGYDNRNIYVETGKYGSYRFYLEYDQLPKRISDNSRTPFTGAGSGYMTLPGFVQPATAGVLATTTQILAANPALRFNNIELETKRTTGKAGFSKTLGSNLELSLIAKQEDKEGTKSIGGVVGTSGGDTRGIVLPEPVDYTTKEMTAKVGYSGERSQLELAYFISNFENNEDTLSWQNPFSNATGIIRYPNDPGEARLALPPDNRAQRFSLGGGINIGETTRLSGIAEYGIMEQDETLLPFTANTALMSVAGGTCPAVGTSLTSTSCLPRTKADAEIDITNLKLNLSTKLTNRLALGLNYKYYQTENKITKDLWQKVKNDSRTAAGPAQYAITDGSTAYNLPYDQKQNQAGADAVYYLPKGTTLKLGYVYDRIERNYRESGETTEHTVNARLSGRAASSTLWTVYASEAKRTDDGYEEAHLGDELHSIQYLTGTCATAGTGGLGGRLLGTNTCFDNNPLLRKYDIADRETKKFGGNIRFMATQNVSTGIYFNSKKDDYFASFLGLQEAENQNTTLDITYTPSDSASFYTYYTDEVSRSTQANRTNSGLTKAEWGSLNETNLAGTINVNSRNWWMDQNDYNDTVGIGANMGFMDNKLTMAADVSYSKSVSKVQFRHGGGANFTAAPGVKPMPDIESTLNTFNLNGKYKVKKNLSVGAGYALERYVSDDWQTDNVNPGTNVLANVFVLSGSTQNYTSHTGMVFVTYNFGI